MIAGIYNITCEQGSTFSRTFTITTSDGDAFDLTNYSARLQIRKDFDSTTTLFSGTVANGAITVQALLGKITVDMTATQTASITRDGVYDLEIYTDEGVVYKVVKGRFNLSREVTK